MVLAVGFAVAGQEVRQIVRRQAGRCREQGFRHESVYLTDQVQDQDDDDCQVVREVDGQYCDDGVLADQVDPQIGPVALVKVLEDQPQHEQAKYHKSSLVLALGLLVVAPVVDQDVVQPGQQHEPCRHVDYVLADLIEMPIDAGRHQ